MLARLEDFAREGERVSEAVEYEPSITFSICDLVGVERILLARI